MLEQLTILPLLQECPKLQQGHEYLLLVTHPTGTQSGYSLAFGGGTAVLNDPAFARSAFCQGQLR